jgi:hypothetical protein
MRAIIWLCMLVIFAVISFRWNAISLIGLAAPHSTDEHATGRRNGDAAKAVPLRSRRASSQCSGQAACEAVDITPIRRTSGSPMPLSPNAAGS